MAETRGTNPVELTMGPGAVSADGAHGYPGLTVPGVIRARRVMAVEGQPRCLTVYEFERPDVPASEATPRLEGP